MVSSIFGSSSYNIKKRIAHHFTMLRGNKHSNIVLQSSVNKHGLENFKAEVLCYCEPEVCLLLEQHILDLLRPFVDEKRGYNIAKNAYSSKKRYFATLL